MKFNNIQIKFGVFIILIVVLFQIFFTQSPKLKKCSDAIMIIKTIEKINKETGIKYSHIYNYFNANISHKIEIEFGNVNIFAIDCNSWGITGNMRILILAMENLPNFAQKYLEYVKSKANNNLKSIHTLEKTLNKTNCQNEIQ